ncbi:hypothetical protein VOLCADRAFT_103490 [Volvox carteri f. nagariensis]|uniref:peptidylprolyl isomerase n=1 Tax=Volvox carteri f. nagariensis TaxID=3068 RepID=D8TM89_VOLCA|nr:uncharacterized protein VOLCADRAFT_103490 [Volvox carteri f. nagariensis]EFJ51600.1 hypothetical protein VOLCADRAFT_103490 [Volvox carteri f. nagariensis]|eukprot:XP_002947552.1 hypothetical protein VOLCADRAFT_103490 [Volvox carteri f. nagariensis]
MALVTQKAFCSPQAHVGGRTRLRAVRVCCQSRPEQAADAPRRNLLQKSVALVAAAAVLAGSQSAAALAASLPPQDIKVLCDVECSAALEAVEAVTLPSGLKYKDISPGSGPSPPVGFQVVANYVAMTPNLRVFDSSLEKGKPYDIRVGAGQIIKGLDEGLLGMKPGGIRRLYIPGDLAFPKGLKAAPGRPAVPPATPVVFDVQLLYIPGLEGDE